LVQGKLVLLDACSLVNLYASGDIGRLLTDLPFQFAITEMVRDEAQFVFRGGSGPDRRDRDSVELIPLLDAGLIRVTEEATEEELVTFIGLASELDDGEAMTGAIAIHRAFTVATDDKKATRVLTERHVQCTSTLSLINQWGTQFSIPDSRLREMMTLIRERARYVPHGGHPLRAWWESLFAGDE
jgi:predicted nucleic acid-binding protein